MSTIKSSAENLTLNADGANNDIKFQSNGSEVASLDENGVFTATSFSGGGSTPSIVDGGNATAINIDSSENVGIGHPLNSHTQRLVVKKTAAITSLAGGGGINIVNEQGVGNFTNLRFTGASQNAYIGFRDGANDQDRRLSIGVGADAEHFSFSQAGLKFNGDTAEANGLDDYEEGTWTPANQWITITNAVTARYVKIGNMVTVWGNITFASSPADVSQAGGRIQGLPFTPLGGDHPFLASWWANATTGARKPDNYDFFVNASTTLQIYNRTSSRVAQRAQVASSHMKFQATYQVS